MCSPVLWGLGPSFDQCNPFDNLFILRSGIRPNFTHIELSLTVRMESKKNKNLWLNAIKL